MPSDSDASRPVPGAISPAHIDRHAERRLHAIWQPMLVLAAYCLLSLAFVGHGASLSNEIIGTGSDCYIFIWFLQWWPWALAHHSLVLNTPLVWQPFGYNLAWTTSIPLLAFLGAPVTAWFGPVVTLNILTLCAPVLSAFTAYLLCLYLTKNRYAAFAGGFLFGFSPFEMAETLQEMNLEFTFLIPLLALWTVQRLSGDLGRFRYALCGAIGLAAQFYISVEFFAMTALVALLGWILAMIFLPPYRTQLRALLTDAAVMGLLTLALISPLLWPMVLAPSYVNVPENWVIASSAQLFNLLVPSATEIYTDSGIKPLNTSFFGLIPKYDYTLGLPLIFILLDYARKNWMRPEVRVSYVALVLIFLASLGPFLRVGSHLTSFALPWLYMSQLPLIHAVLPVRLTLFSTLMIAIIFALWLASLSPRVDRLRIIFGGLTCLVFLPTPLPSHAVPVSQFFAPGEAQKFIPPNALLLILPESKRNPSSYWQAENLFGFMQTQGTLGWPEPAAMRYPAVLDIAFRVPSEHLGADIRDYAIHTKTQFIVAPPGTPPDLLHAVQSLGWERITADDMTLFKVPLGDN